MGMLSSPLKGGVFASEPFGIAWKNEIQYEYFVHRKVPVSPPSPEQTSRSRAWMRGIRFVSPGGELLLRLGMSALGEGDPEQSTSTTHAQGTHIQIVQTLDTILASILVTQRHQRTDQRSMAKY